MTSKRDYTKDIIEEYNIRLKAWGSSNNWGLTEFKMLEDLIYESSKMRINANTLKRFFQQRTSNPQLATTNALCIFLGYSGYAEFVMKKTEEAKDSGKKDRADSAKDTSENDQTPPKETSDFENNTKIEIQKKHFLKNQYLIGVIVVISAFLLVFIFGGKLKEKYNNYLMSSIVFESTLTKGASPFTVKVEYDIPKQLLDSMKIICKEANGDFTVKKLIESKNELFLTFIYPGNGYCNLEYKGRVIRSIEVISRTPGWSTFVIEERGRHYSVIPFQYADTTKGYLTLPLDRIPQDAITDKLFVSYDYYADSIIDGDNFIFEAGVRNSGKDDHGIPCYDIMMYALSNTAMHGFALNESCYSYLKFLSSEKNMNGEQYDLTHVDFNPNIWHTMSIEVVDKKTTFYLDDKIVLKMDYEQPLGIINELTLRFKGCGAVEYIKVKDPKANNKIVYERYFNTYNNRVDN